MGLVGGGEPQESTLCVGRALICPIPMHQVFEIYSERDRRILLALADHGGYWSSQAWGGPMLVCEPWQGVWHTPCAERSTHTQEPRTAQLSLPANGHVPLPSHRSVRWTRCCAVSLALVGRRLRTSAGMRTTCGTLRRCGDAQVEESHGVRADGGVGSSDDPSRSSLFLCTWVRIGCKGHAGVRPAASACLSCSRLN
jgi:hypothetical protein